MPLAGLQDKVAIVTGAGSGIGTETARALASAGAEVVLAVRRPQAAGQIAAGIAGAHLVTIPQSGHVSALEQPEEVTRALLEWLQV